VLSRRRFPVGAEQLVAFAGLDPGY